VPDAQTVQQAEADHNKCYQALAMIQAEWRAAYVPPSDADVQAATAALCDMHGGRRDGRTTGRPGRDCDAQRMGTSRQRGAAGVRAVRRSNRGRDGDLPDCRLSARKEGHIPECNTPHRMGKAGAESGTFVSLERHEE
jgi:hypothetical protein